MALSRRTLLRTAIGIGATLGAGPLALRTRASAETLALTYGPHPALENYVLAARDWTAKYQLRTNMEWFSAGGASNDALASGKINANSPGAGPVIALNAALPGKFALIMAWSDLHSGSATLVRPDSPYRTLADLKGKKMGVLVGSGAYLSWILQLEDLGLKLDDYQIVNLPGENLGAALSTNAIDAATVWEPLVVLMEQQGIGRAVARFPAGGGDGTFVQARTDELARLRPAFVRLVAGFLDVQDFIRNHPTEAAKQVSASMARQGINVPWQAFEALVKQGRYVFKAEFTPTLKSFLARQAQLALRLGRIKQEPKFTFADDIVHEAQRLRS